MHIVSERYMVHRVSTGNRVGNPGKMAVFQATEASCDNHPIHACFIARHSLTSPNSALAARFAGNLLHAYEACCRAAFERTQGLPLAYEPFRKVKENCIRCCAGDVMQMAAIAQPAARLGAA